MKYKIIHDQGEKYIQFNEKKYMGLQEMINTIHLHRITLEDILEKIKLIQTGVSNFEEIGTERIMIEISVDGCEIYDLFEDIIGKEDSFQRAEISLEELKGVILFLKNL